MDLTRRQLLTGACACAGCLSSLAISTMANARVLPTRLESLVGPGYIPQDQDERGMWQSLEEVEEAFRTSPQRLDAPKFDAYTRGVVERLVQRPVPDLRIYLVRGSSVNASMFPSGMMIVHTGLIARMRNEAQYAAVLGHEAGHYFRKHSIQVYRNMRRKASAGAFLSLLGGLAGSAVATAPMLSVLQFSRT